MKPKKLIMKPKKENPKEWKDNEKWIYEKKYDGSRHLYTNNGLFSKREIDRKERFKHIYKELKRLNATLDLEIYLPSNENVIELNKQENWENTEAIAIDILKYNGIEMRTQPLQKRQRKTQEVTHDLKYINTPQTYQSYKEIWNKAKKEKWEGVIAKKLNSHYINKRSDKWIKLKRRRTIDTDIIDHEKGKDTGTFIIHYKGKELRVNCPSEHYLKKYRNGDVCVEVSYQRETKNGKLFHPVIEKFIKQ